MEDDRLENKLSEDNIKSLINFGLTSEEVSVYASLLKRGKRGEVVGSIKKELTIGRTTIYAILERLCEKEWAISKLISENPRRIKYIAKPPLEILNQIIEKKEKELKRLKDSSLFIGDSLDKIYQGSKKLTIDTVHIGGYKYLKPLVEQGWKIKSEVIEHNEALERLTLDYELKGSKGFPKDCGLIIFYFSKDIENNQGLIQEALDVLKKKSEYEIRKEKIPGFEDVQLIDTTFKGYYGANVLIKLKIKKKPWLVGKEAVIPIKKTLFLIFGNKENFEILLSTIINSEQFHHLV
ncbi:MAG: helix-turn-helix domain-containing protein [Promethearchaeota archaeon]